MSYYEKTVKNVEEYLKDSGHNIVAKTSAGSWSGYICESLSDDTRFFTKIRVDKTLDFVIVESFPLITVQKAFRPMAAEFCMIKTNACKVGSLCVDPTYGNFYSHVESSFEFGALPPDFIDTMEKISLSCLMFHYDEMQCIARGVLPNKEDKKSLDADLLSQLAHELNLDLDDLNDLDDSDDSDDSDSSAAAEKEGFLPNISALLSELDRQEDEEDND